MSNSSLFRTSDLSLSTALVCLKYPLISVVKDGSRWYFEFENTPELQSSVKNYFAYDALIEPMDYFNTLKTLKTRLYNHSEVC